MDASKKQKQRTTGINKPILQMENLRIRDGESVDPRDGTAKSQNLKPGLCATRSLLLFFFLTLAKKGIYWFT